MKITSARQQNSSPDYKTIILYSGAVLLLFCAGFIFRHQGWGAPLTTFARTYLAHPLFTLNALTHRADLPTMYVDMAFQDYRQMFQQRERALERGVYIAARADYVPANIRFDNAEIPVLIRLQEGAVTRRAAKWEFQVRTEDEYELRGMTRFTLQDPTSNNYLSEWAFRQNLRIHEILAPRYEFVRLVFNGDDWGAYALAERFSYELLQNQERAEGVIVGFDAKPYLEQLAQHAGEVNAARQDSVTNWSAASPQYLEIDTARDAYVSDSPELTAQQDRAIELLRALQAGKQPAAEILDVEQYGAFLALADLWGAPAATQAMNLHFYYNPHNDKLEPIGANGQPFSDTTRVSLALCYEDPLIQTAYARAAWQFSQPEYLARLQDELTEPLNELQLALGMEYGKLEMPWSALRTRQELMRASLAPIQPIFAYYAATADASIVITDVAFYVDIGNPLNLPVEIVGFDFEEATFLDADPAWVLPGTESLLVDAPDAVILRAVERRDTPQLSFVRFKIPLREITARDSELDFATWPRIYVVTRLMGLKEEQHTLVQPERSEQTP